MSDEATVQKKDSLTLNIAPASFSKETIVIGRIAYTDEVTYRNLREEHWQTHAFRFDTRDKMISNVAIMPGVQPLGDVQPVPVQDHLLLMATALQQSILLWLTNRLKLPILKSGKRLMFWGGRPESRLLSRAVTEQKLTPIPEVEVIIRYDVDARMFWTPGNKTIPYLGVLIDISTSNVIDLSVADLLSRGFDVVGRYVCKRGYNELEYLRPPLDLVGMVTQVESGRLLLTDTEGLTEMPAKDAFLEPRSENLDAVIRTIYGSNAGGVLARLKQLRAPLTTATGKLEQIRQTLAVLQRRDEIVLGDEVRVRLGDLLSVGDAYFPPTISTSRPSCLFGPQGRHSGSQPDSGIQNWGPFKYMQHTRNTPLIAVVCESSHRGRVEQFINLLRDGFPDADWKKATAWRNDDKPNPFSGGLIGKFRLNCVNLEYEEAADATAVDYKRAADRLLERLPKSPDLAIVQIRDSFRKLRGEDNPYLVSKAAFMTAGIPVQAVEIENMESDDTSLPYILNNVALGSYAKLDGTPWVISTRAPTSHELVIGLVRAVNGSFRFWRHLIVQINAI